MITEDYTSKNYGNRKKSELTCWYYDHNFNRNMKGINLLNCVYKASGVSLPIAFELVKKSMLIVGFHPVRIALKFFIRILNQIQL